MYFLNADNFGKDNRGGACCYYGEWAHLLNLAGAQANRILEGLVVFLKKLFISYSSVFNLEDILSASIP